MHPVKAVNMKSRAVGELTNQVQETSFRCPVHCASRQNGMSVFVAAIVAVASANLC